MSCFQPASRHRDQRAWNPRHDRNRNRRSRGQYRQYHDHPRFRRFPRNGIDIEVNDLKHLNTIISHLRARPVVSKVERVNG